jgi:hypothetical protein
VDKAVQVPREGKQAGVRIFCAGVAETELIISRGVFVPVAVMVILLRGGILRRVIDCH